MLKVEGFDISTATILDIQKVLANLGDEEINNTSELKLILAPFICRNKEEQEKFHKIFDQYENAIQSGIQNPPVSITPIRDNKNRKRKIIIASVIGALLLFLFFIWLYTKSANPLISFTTQPSDGPYLVVNTPIQFTSQLYDTSRNEKYSVNWKIADSIYSNRRTVDVSFQNAGNHNIEVWLENDKGEKIATHTAAVSVNCEKPPYIAIQKISSPQNAAARKIDYWAQITNPASDTTQYKYSWFINDSLISNSPIFYSNYKSDAPYLVKVRVDYDKSVHCSTDSLFAVMAEMPAYDLAVTGTEPLALKADLKWSSIALAGLYSLLLPASVAAFVLYFKRRKKIPAKKTDVPVDDKQQELTGPYKIEFKKQDDKITPDKEISQLAEVMRKRHVSDVMLLNVRRTIQKTIRSGGFPLLHFTPKTQPTDFLVFLDKENAGGHQVQLFEYIITKLQKEQVNITTYNFYKEPLLLSNEKLNHNMLPVEKVARLYPNTILFIFSNTNAFFQSLNTKLKPWVIEKFKLWQHKIIFTPVAINDWDYKETALLKAGFTVVPADLNAHQLITYEINDLINREKLKKLGIPASYSSRFINFENWAELKNYLNNDPHLLQWLCALSVYAYVDWKATVALGKAIEENIGEDEKLVTYSNLLKLSRITWMQTGAPPDALRIQMLKHLDTKTEVIARKTMTQLLEEVEADITESSLIKDEFQLNKTINKFLLHTHNPNEIALTDGDKESMKEYVQNQWLDYPLEKYLQTAENTLLKDEQGKKSITPEAYFELEDQVANKKLTREKNLRRTIAAAAMLAGVVLLYGFFKNEPNYKTQQQFADIRFNLSSPNNNINPALAKLFVITPDSTYEAAKTSNAAFVVKQLRIDSTQQASIKIETPYGNLSFEKPLDLKSQTYNLTIAAPASKLPLYVRYNNAASYAAVEKQLVDALPQFTISPMETSFTDSSRIIYYEQNQKPRADSIVQQVRQALGINVRTEFIEEIRTPPATPILFLNLTPTSSCNTIAINTLPASLNEIWKGRTSNRLVNIDINKRLIYYSTGNKTTYGTYRIDEVCMSTPGTYKIITIANAEYQTFLLKSLQPANFELSVCQTRYKTKEEARAVDESYCDKADRMNLYFENDPKKIFFNYNSGNLSGAQLNKLRMVVTEERKKYTASYVTATGYYNQLIQPRGLSNDVMNGLRTKAELKPEEYRSNSVSFSGTPFDRSYILVNATEVYEPNPNQNNVDNIQPACDRIFYSMQEALAVNARVVCKLNIEKENLTALPKELYQFVNMQELTLGRTAIPESEIKNLQSTLPRCKINYSSQQQTRPVDTAYRQLAIIYFNAPGQISRPDIAKIRQIEKELLGNANAKIRLVAFYENDREQKAAIENVAAIRKNISAPGRQIEEQIIKRSASGSSVEPQQQNQFYQVSNEQASKNNSMGTGPHIEQAAPRTSVIIYGLNFNNRQLNAPSTGY